MRYRADWMKLWALITLCLNLGGIFLCLAWLAWLAIRGLI
jgi:hypothetical protein